MLSVEIKKPFQCIREIKCNKEQQILTPLFAELDPYSVLISSFYHHNHLLVWYEGDSSDMQLRIVILNETVFSRF